MLVKGVDGAKKAWSWEAGPGVQSSSTACLGLSSLRVRRAKASCGPDLPEMAFPLCAPCRLDKSHSARLSEV